jgi:hypothetical protein
MIDGIKIYMGTVDNIFKAAILFDIVTIQNRGLKAKVNFCYTKLELLAMLLLPNLTYLKKDGHQKTQLC